MITRSEDRPNSVVYTYGASFVDDAVAPAAAVFNFGFMPEVVEIVSDAPQFHRWGRTFGPTDFLDVAAGTVGAAGSYTVDREAGTLTIASPAQNRLYHIVARA